MKKYLVLGALLLALVIAPLTVKASTIDDLMAQISALTQQIQSKDATIAQLQAQIVALMQQIAGGGNVCPQVGSLKQTVQNIQAKVSGLSGLSQVDQLNFMVLFLQSRIQLMNLEQAAGCGVPPSVTPSISSVSSKGGSEGDIYIGEPVYVSGSNLSGLAVVYIGPNTIPIEKNYGDTVTFTAPSTLVPGSYYLQLVGKANETNSLPVTVKNLVAPTLSITITSPKLGDTYKTGDTVHVLWSGSEPDVTEYAVYLIGGALGSAGSQYLGTTGADVPFNWVVPANIATSKGYQIQLSGKGVSGGNSDSFTITSPVVDQKCLKADVNSSGAVDNLDILAVRGQFGCNVGTSTSTNCIKADVNSSGAVDNLDILAVRGQFGCSVPVPSVGQVSKLDQMASVLQGMQNLLKSLGR